MKELLKVEIHPNENCRTYHVRTRLTRKMIEAWHDLDDAAIAPVFVRRIFSIDGVCSVSIGQYSIMICKANLFSWDELEPRIQAIIELELPESPAPNPQQ